MSPLTQHPSKALPPAHFQRPQILRLSRDQPETSKGRGRRGWSRVQPTLFGHQRFSMGPWAAAGPQTPALLKVRAFSGREPRGMFEATGKR